MAKTRWNVRSCAAALGVMCVVACDPPPPEPEPGELGSVVTVPLGVTFSPLSMEHGDFDGDLAADVLVGGVTLAGGATTWVFRGNGDGTLQPAIDTGLFSCSAHPVVGDLDGNARTDAIALGCSNDLAVAVGQPDATLAPWTAWPPNTYSPLPVSGVAIGDFEGDGDGDVFVLRIDATGNSALVDIEMSNAAQGFWGISWGFSGGVYWSPNAAGFHPTQILLAHLDGDGLLDLVLTDRDNAVARMLGSVPDAFALPLELDLSVNPGLTRTGDLDGDGLDDLVVVSRTDSAVQVLLSTGDGDLVPQAPVVLPFAPYDATLGRFNGDEYLDVALVDDATPQVLALRGDGAGGLGDAVRRALPSGAIRVHAADFDGDAVDDVLAATFADGSLSLVLSTLP
jgi:hypothetical protein